jgi:hypothetical protein
MVFSVKCILTPPTELEFAERTLHELTPTTPLDKARASRTQLTPNDLVEVRKQRHLSRQVGPQTENATFESQLIITLPRIDTLRTLIVNTACLSICKAKGRAGRIRTSHQVTREICLQQFLI